MPLLLSQLENSPGPVPPGKAGSDGTGAGVSMDAARGRLKALFPGDFPDQVPRSQTVFSSRGSPAETPARSNPDPSHHGCRVSSSPARGRSRSPEVLPRSPSNQSFGLGTSPARGRPRSPVRSRSPVRGGKVRAIHGMVLPARADNGKLTSLLLAEPGSSTDSASSTMAKGPDSSYLRQYPEHPMSRLVQVDPSAESLKDVSTHSTGSEGKVSISGRTLTRNNSYGSFAAWAGQHAERVKHAVVKKGSRLMSVTNNATSSEVRSSLALARTRLHARLALARTRLHARLVLARTRLHARACARARQRCLSCLLSGALQACVVEKVKLSRVIPLAVMCEMSCPRNDMRPVGPWVSQRPYATRADHMNGDHM